MIVGLTGLIKMELPSQDVRLCDGGFFDYGGEIYEAEDATYGTIGSVRTMQVGVGDIVPALVMTLLPPTATAVSQIAQPGHQTSRITFSIAEYNAETGEIITGASFFDGQLDQTILDIDDSGRSVTMSVVSLAERLFERNIGNTMNATWHKSVWEGELGQDNATGLNGQVAWGTETQGGGIGGGSGRGVTFGDIFIRQVQMEKR